ncbi:PREDICTED: GATA transcription factor 26 isoform X1 [Lupinus angustifolius]|uniref:GATA transcription factor 26 isoform X1 n=1 Tax=Lupinus angustifolius TaxID=3871 RepID=UPI00092E239A|nr:PREDICTED: GATA transcription factor 26 isoform X1 [Lupinus angustifolius]
MGKQGPCYHCGVTSTPLWRNGPPEKPVLCNACGSRWRTKGTLANYIPLHARAEGADYEDQRVSRVKSISLNKNKEMKSLKRKLSNDNVVFGGLAPDYNQGFRKALDEDTSNRSSSGSAISNSESCAQFGGMDASDLTGPAQPVVWDTVVPSKKRTCVGHPKHSSVEKLTKDLCTILQEQQSCFSASSEGELLFESETPMVSVEIGHGSILIRHPSYIAREEESEASSLSVDNKQCTMNEAYSYPGAVLMRNDSNSITFSSHRVEKVGSTAGQGMQQEQLKRDKSQLERVQILGNHDSPLSLIDLNDVVNYEEFLKNLTKEEQQQLLKFLPVVDAVKLPDSLKFMFDSSQFKENLTYFQQLLAEGVFDITLSGAKQEDCKTLKRQALSNLSKSKWVEHYYFLKKCKSRTGKSVNLGSNGTLSTNVVNVKRSRDYRNQNFPELNTTMRSPKRVIANAGCEGKEVVEDGSYFSPKSLFALPPDASSLLLDSLNFVDESSDQDLLLEVPSNNSFPQAELLPPNLSFGAQASTSSSSVYSNLLHR